MREAAIRRYLLDSPQLGAYCRQNGWIDNDSLRYEIEWRTAAEAIVRIRFEEVIMEGSGCIANRLEHFLKLQFRFAADSDAVETAEPL